MSPTPDSARSRRLSRHVRPTDLQAASQLITLATHGLIDVTEGVHQAVRRRIGLSAGATPERTGGLTGRVYQAVRGVTGAVGLGSGALVKALLPLIDDPAAHEAPSPQREAVLAALNGVLGDRLLAMGNGLAQAMELRLHDRVVQAGAAVDIAGAQPHLLLMVHGLCMNDAQWRRNGHDHTDLLAPALQATPLRLRYNTGLHIAANGRELAHRLEALAGTWPVPLRHITIVGHSMGGLVARSAVHHALQVGHRWPARLTNLVFLGTPHHGAPLERAGHGVDLLLASSPFTAPLARLGRLRSAGITDLRHAHLHDGDSTAPMPLPEGVACFGVAACLAPRRGLLAERLVGDGLVPLHSALGEHDDPQRRLVFARDSLFTVHRTGHLDLLSSPAVAEQLLRWLAPQPPA